MAVLVGPIEPLGLGRSHWTRVGNKISTLYTGTKETDKEHAVNIMNVSVFPTAVMNVILRHRNLLTVKNGWLQEDHQYPSRKV
jgi:hypothetical protein